MMLEPHLSEVKLNVLFSYGSMSEGRVHYGRIANLIQTKRRATIRGSVYRLESGFPVYCQEGDDIVPGTLVELGDTMVLWKVLDELFGFSPLNPDKSLFQRVTVSIVGEDTLCYVYAINANKLPRSSGRIHGGDWEKDICDREPMVTCLTPNQRHYIQKLGRSTGRDIVPINLDLYRELMNKGLIVDKGRRLALTSLGQEVFRYLE